MNKLELNQLNYLIAKSENPKQLRALISKFVILNLTEMAGQQVKFIEILKNKKLI